ncbi:MAG TPA: hypothetical protein VJ964_05415 [Balneolaceae bacterium]|nr:hypothetical protein [Balneolaceae bacterium]
MKRHQYQLLTCLLIVLSILILPDLTRAQSTSFIPTGLGFEIGAGYNQLFWRAYSPSLDKTTTENRTAFSIMPSFRINYKFNVYSNISLYTFLGFNEFGGYSKLHKQTVILDANALYKDQITFKTFDLGFIGLYKFGDVSIGGGFKLNRHLQIRNRSYYENNPHTPNGWSTDDISYFFKDWSADSGLRIEYSTPLRMILGAESWFGITNLGTSKYATDFHIHENHFRLLIGYRF